MTEISYIPEPDDPVLVTPERVQFIYERTNDGDDLIGLLLTDPSLGALFVALAYEQAVEIATNLAAMTTTGGLDELRRNWIANNTDNG